MRRLVMGSGWTWGRVINGHERFRLAAGTFVSVMALTFGWPLGTLGLVICLAGIAIGVAIVAPAWSVDGQLAPLRLTYRSAQVRLGERTLRSDMTNDESYQQFDGVHGWIWMGGVPDGGSGVAFDPTDRLVDDDFAREAWWSITGDTATCESLYDHWYWCGVS